MKRPEATRIQLEHRQVWEAVRAAGGNVTVAAHTLGVTTRDLLLQLAAAPPRPEMPARMPSRDDEPAWGDDGESE